MLLDIADCFLSYILIYYHNQKNTSL